MYFEMIYYTGNYDSDGGFTSMLVRLEEDVVNQLVSNQPPAFIKIMVNEGETRLINTQNINMFIEMRGGTNPQGAEEREFSE